MNSIVISKLLWILRSNIFIGISNSIFIQQAISGNRALVPEYTHGFGTEIMQVDTRIVQASTGITQAALVPK
jgi:hypothetical protein